MSIINALVFLAAVTGCGSSGTSPHPAGEPIDTLAILEAAVEHHFVAEAMDSAALDLEERPEDKASLIGTPWRRLAERLEMPVARHSEVVQCEPGPPFERECHVIGMERLIRVSIDEIGTSSAIVTVSAWVESVPGHVSVEGAQYLLEREGAQWSVTERLMGFAS